MTPKQQQILVLTICTIVVVIAWAASLADAHTVTATTTARCFEGGALVTVEFANDHDTPATIGYQVERRAGAVTVAPNSKLTVTHVVPVTVGAVTWTAVWPDRHTQHGEGGFRVDGLCAPPPTVPPPTTTPTTTSPLPVVTSSTVITRLPLPEAPPATPAPSQPRYTG